MNKEKTQVNKNTVSTPVTLDAQQRLVEIMTDSPRLCDFDGTQWEVRALHPGTQWLIAQEAIAIQRKENESYGDTIKNFAANVPSVAKVITLCLLNDRQRIFANGRCGEYSEEFNAVYDTILWNTPQKYWLKLLLEILEMLDISCFFAITSSVQIFRQRTSERKMTVEETRQ